MLGTVRFLLCNINSAQGLKGVKLVISVCW